MRVVARTLSWLLVLSSSTAIAQGPAAGTAAQDRPPDAPTPIRGVEPTGMKILTHYSEGVLGPHDVTLQGNSVIGAHIRIVTTSTVEIPDLVRLDGRAISGRVLLSDDDTVTTSGGLDRPNVTLPRPRRAVVGVITGLQRETLTSGARVQRGSARKKLR
jgi:hypothetical protein